MRVGIAYLGVVLIWATSPLAVKWSNSSLSFVAAVSARLCVAFVICWILMMVLRKSLISHRSDWLAYLAGALGMFPNMLIVYWSARYIPSGLVAVIFGFYPFVVGFFSFLILKENIFNYRRMVALVVAVCGLAIININQLQLGDKAIWGVLGVLASTFLFGLSSVLLKRVGHSVPPLEMCTGTITLSLPLFVVTWFILDGEIPSYVDVYSFSSVLYLAVAGSVLGGILFFYVLKHCRVATVGLITFLTPIISLLIGVLFDGDVFDAMTIVGSILILISLAIYQNVLSILPGALNACKKTLLVLAGWRREKGESCESTVC